MEIARLIFCAFSVVKFMMIIQSFELPRLALDLIKKTNNDKERMFLAKLGMFFDCPVCISVVASVIVFLLEISPLSFLNVILGLSVIGVIIRKRCIRE